MDSMSAEPPEMISAAIFFTVKEVILNAEK